METLREKINKQRKYFSTGETKDINFRIEKLKKLRDVLKSEEEKIFEALKKDLMKSSFESYVTEVAMVYDEINMHIKNIKKWSKKRRVKTPLVQFPAKSFIKLEPYGVVLIIGPFNYPFMLTMDPLIGAIAAGNTAVIKPSESAPETSKILKEILEKVFDEKYVLHVNPERGKEVVEELLKEKFDYIFFTGSATVGKIVMKAASQYLTPITLELGGKSPCIIDKDCKLELAARRIVWGKLLNSGQTCVAPDYLYVHKDIEEEFIKKLEEEIKNQFGNNPLESEDYSKMVNEREFNRVLSYIDKEKLVFGGNYNRKTFQIEPTILKNVTWNDPVMEREIFGPIFPILSFENLDEVIRLVNSKDKPLALYYFSEDKNKIEKVINSTSSGGVTINDTLVHVSSSYLPFGGVGNSGMGEYHGKYSFDLFSNKKGVMNRKTFLDLKIRYAPFLNKLTIVKKIMK
ncbi:aldehyde dehydrogenase [Clostridium perfringens]|uniref:Aldehyde dehydrogenase n=2 Tax=Clostridium perfringens TaxID=1502 RepID=A0A2X2Y316_CLOPF|nr:aldehyde dehydrogenase [Clostridium perfringens]ABG86837.1 aldehyde dehydrogenase family protein [Clostridium perfringens SM101]EJT5940595.1 aldehyde dehydrogenase [Clostridium perfringens]EJT6150354.1 aldehyde dehydrogenase [Clostridium perfringens]EJT6155978.1 aldehyde dehydrogenase [Clostridium perfringens]EJT6472757.1 aldehyde dehydrogenase [Clostridium perfringens]